MSYKRLGDYIQQVNQRNKDLEVDTLLGVSITKKLIPSIANTIGTDMSTYKIIERGQFAYGTITSRNGEKISIALASEYDSALVSQIYVVFEVVDTNVLLPEYLMMWFSRPEFDRYVRYHSHGSTREAFDWEDMCEVELPIPSIEKQREVVAQYQAVANKIKVNEQICEKLEATAQALYKHWFVDFEFPDENGKPYKSSGGKMVYNEELGKEIPEGWEIKSLGNVAEISAGGDKPNVFSEWKTGKNNIPIFSNGVTDNGLYGFTNKANYPKGSTTISARGTIGFSVLRNEPFDAIVRLLVLTPKLNNLSIYLWHTVRLIEFDNSGSVQNQLTKPQVIDINILIPLVNVLEKYQFMEEKIYRRIDSKKNEIQKLIKLQLLLLSRLATLNN